MKYLPVFCELHGWLVGVKATVTLYVACYNFCVLRVTPAM